MESKNETVSTHRWHDFQHRKFQGIYKKAPRSNEFTKVTDIRSRYKNHLYFYILEMKT